MANPSFWFYGHDSTLTELQLPGPLTELSWVPLRDRRSGWTLAGDMKSAVNTGRLRVTITLGPFNDTGSWEHLAHRLESMSSHLERGLPVSFAADRAKAWLSSAQTAADSTLLTYGPNVCAAYNASTLLAGADRLCLESPNPELHREYLRVLTNTAAMSALELADPIIYDAKASPLMLRHRDFFPVLYMPEDMLGRSLVAHDHRLTFTLDVSLEQSIEGQAALVDTSGDMTVSDGFFSADVAMHGDGPGTDGSDGESTGYSLQRVLRLGGGRFTEDDADDGIVAPDFGGGF